jgi:hypothetical protein
MRRYADGCPRICAAVPLGAVIGMPAGIGSAEAVSRRVGMASSSSSPITGCSKTIMGSGCVSGHLGPQEPGELARDRGSDNRADVLAGGELLEPFREAYLRVPGARDDLG